MTLDQALQLAVQHHQAGRLGQAESIYRQILQQQPNHPGALHLLGLLAGQAGRADVAVEMISRAIQLNPNIPEFHNNLGAMLLGLRRFDEALAAFERVIQLNPNSPEAHYNLGNTLAQLNRFEEAGQRFREALRIKPDYVPALSNLGSALQERGQFRQAIQVFEQTLTLAPDLPEAHFGMANCRRGCGDLDAAIDAYRRAIASRPDPAFHSAMMITMHLHPDFTGQSLYREHVAWRQRYTDPLRSLIKPHLNDRDPDRRLRVGYISHEFRDHVIGRYAMHLIAHHDHTALEVALYSDVSRPDAMTQEFRAAADLWRDIAGASHTQVADLIREDRIDILIDLSCHLKGNRLPVFAQKPAPVSAEWLSYPGTSGLDTIDYRITDRYLDPPGVYDADYSEKSVQLPDSYWCYAPPRGCDAIDVSPMPALSRGSITFGCLNNPSKLNSVVVELWCRVLGSVPGSRLMALAESGEHRDRLIAEIREKGIDPSRVELLARLPTQQYMALYQQVDVGLDTFPYNGHTTTLDALWMGVPVATLSGSTCVSRGGSSILHHVNLPELVATSRDEFVSRATELATDLPRLAELRSQLRDRMKSSPLCDLPGFARGMETLYRTLWRNWTAS